MFQIILRPRRKLPSAGKPLLIAIALLAVPSFAQSSQTPRATAPADNPAASTSLAFEVSTVKLNKSGGSGSDSDYDHGRFTASNVLLKSLIEYQAYGIPEPRIFGGPKWLNSVRFDIEAKLDSAGADRLQALGREQRKVQMQAMFQQLLADRFKMAIHFETRELPVYALVVAKNGPILTQTQQPEGDTGISANTGGFTAKGISIPDLCKALTQDLSRDLGRVVIDKTGLAGRYDLTLKWTPDPGTAPLTSGTDAASDSAPSIFTAVQEQLGLKLESTKGPVQVLVIDHVEMPTEN